MLPAPRAPPPLLPQLRYVLMAGQTDGPEDIEALIQFCSNKRSMQAIEVLPYHLLGVQVRRLGGRGCGVGSAPAGRQGGAGCVRIEGLCSCRSPCLERPLALHARALRHRSSPAEVGG